MRGLQKKVFASRKDGSSARKAARKRLVCELSGRSAGVRCCPLRALRPHPQATFHQCRYLRS